MINLKPPQRARSRAAGFALALAWFAVVVVLYAVVLLRTGVVEPLGGFAAFTAGLALAVLAVIAGLIAAVIVWRTGVKGGARALFAVALGAATLGGPAYVLGRAATAPMINDVSTDLADPPRFERAAADRRAGELPVPGAISPAQAETQKAGYPLVAPLRLPLAPEEVANLALGLVEERGWTVLGPTSFPRGGGPTGRIQAVARTTLLGLKDDVVIRVRADEAGSRVDMRSASRIGRSDLGANAERIRSFFADLATAANVAPQ